MQRKIPSLPMGTSPEVLRRIATGFGAYIKEGHSSIMITEMSTLDLDGLDDFFNDLATYLEQENI